MRVIGAMRRPTTSILGRNNFRSNTGRSGDENDEFNDFDHPLYWMGQPLFHLSFEISPDVKTK